MTESPPPPTSARSGDRLPTLEGRRVRLRWLRSSDLDALCGIFGDPRVARFMGIPRLRGAADARALLGDIGRHFLRGDLFQWGVALVDSDAVVGTCTLAQLSWANERAEVGFALAADHWGGGLMSEAVAILVEHAFGDLGLHRLEADVDPRNDRSLRLLERLGFRREGLLRERHLVGGERQDTVMMGLLAAEWPSESA